MESTSEEKSVILGLMNALWGITDLPTILGGYDYNLVLESQSILP